MRWRFSLLAFVGVLGRLTCKNDTNMDADFWFLIKRPKGTAYMYAGGDGVLAPSSEDLNGTGALNYTVRQLWDGANDYILFNDEPIRGVANASMGHTKGIWMWNMDSGLGGYSYTFCAVVSYWAVTCVVLYWTWPQCLYLRPAYCVFFNNCCRYESVSNVGTTHSCRYI